MKALSILQPYAWLIVNGHKDIENREWSTQFRGRFLVHTGQKYSIADHAAYAEDFREDFGIQLPAYEAMPRGAVVGQAEIVDCVREHPSRWKDSGSWGFVLRNARPLPIPVPWKGRLGFFEIGDVELEQPAGGDLFTSVR